MEVLQSPGIAQNSTKRFIQVYYSNAKRKSIICEMGDRCIEKTDTGCGAMEKSQDSKTISAATRNISSINPVSCRMLWRRTKNNVLDKQNFAGL